MTLTHDGWVHSDTDTWDYYKDLQVIGSVVLTESGWRGITNFGDRANAVGPVDDVGKAMDELEEKMGV